MPDPSQPAAPATITRIARRRALPGHEAQYESLVREMLARMKTFPGFAGAELIPPGAPGGDYQVVVHFDSEAHLATWDASPERSEMFVRMRDHAEGEPEHRRLSGLEAWFEPAVVPASMHPPRHRMAFVTWLGIWPLASLAIWFLSPLLGRLNLPFLLITAINTLLIVASMTYLVMPRLTRALRGFLNPQR